MAMRQTSSGLWVAYFRQNGKLTSRSLMTHDHGEAVQRYKILMSAMTLERFCRTNGIVTDLVKPKRERLKLADCIKVMSKKRTVSKESERAWNKFVANIGVEFADDVTPEMALHYLNTYYSAGNGKTFNNIKSRLNTIYRNVLVEARLRSSPFAPIINRQVSDFDVGHRRNLSDEEIAKVMPLLPIAIQTAVMLSRWTTQRLETVCRMTPEMFDWQKGAFIIMPSKTKRFNKLVVCPILPPLREYLEPIIAGMTPDLPIVLQLANGAKYTPAYISKVFRNALKTAGVESNDAGKAGFHSIRGTAITWYKNHGFSSDVLRRITGHTTTAMEDIYARDVMPVLESAKNISDF